MKQQRGFTLVEMSVVVLMVTILATIGFMMYRRHIGTTRVAEATNLTASIRQAQEAYKSETGVYANVSTSITSFYPADTPGAFVTQWGAPCNPNCIAPDAWNTLGVQPNAPVMFGYATVAGVGGTPTTPKTSSKFKTVAPMTVTATPTPTTPFYTVAAMGDTDGDGVFCHVLATSTDNAIMVDNEGE